MRKVLDQVRELAAGVRGAAGARHELAHRIRPPEDPHAVRAARGAGEPLAPVPGLPADDLPPRPAREPEGLPALRPPHARRRGRAPRLDLRRRQLHPHRTAEGAARSAALPRHQALHRPAEGSARQDASRRRDRGRARQDRRPAGGRRGDGVRIHRRLDGRRGRRGHPRGGAARGAAGGAADRVHRLGRRAHAGRRDQPDADAAHASSPRGW